MALGKIIGRIGYFLKVPIVRVSTLLYRIRARVPLFTFIVSRAISMLVLLFVLGLGIFALMQLAPGDIVDSYVKSIMLQQNDFRESGNIYTDEAIAQAKQRLGLDLPFYHQYLRWLRQVFIERDLGRSLISRAPILFLIKNRMINSVVLNLISLIFLTVISFIVGIYFSSKVGTRIDFMATFTALMLHATPSILLLVLLQLFGSVSRLFPVTAFPDFPISEAPVKFVFSYMHHIFLPLLGGFLGGIGGTMRYIRVTMLDQLGQPYITAIRSRGIRERRIYLAHAFRNTLNPYITSSATLFASLFSGSLILEIIFAYPGIGLLTYEAVRQEDINLVLTSVFFTSFLVLIGIVIADILLAILDPRIRYGKTG